ncbi:hypothetical protein JD844_001157 [Phrynosoma platyrhinos]|uniref:Receptor ligand binding region domain-containing protein n=1 Tax=Phrynosoma platyrhinos TaxID=52577 RepID=A0ABQ7T952_PHRPL|nr:hypothetical protein JD844_001157 [Phrynosoma platyrhinos]
MLPPNALQKNAVMCTTFYSLQVKEQYYQPGDLVIGGITSQLFSVSDPLSFSKHPKEILHLTITLPKNYQHVLSLAFAVKEINENPNILPNITLGFHIYDSYFNAKATYQNTINLLFSQKRTIPNYKCDGQKNLEAVIGGLDSETSVYVATIVGIYKIPQIMYSLSTPDMSGEIQISSIYQMVPNEGHQYIGMVKLLLHFNWKWVGILAISDYQGEKFAQTLEHMFSLSGICTHYTERMPTQSSIADVFSIIDLFQDMIMFLSKTNTDIFVVHADSHMMLDLQWVLFQIEQNSVRFKGKVWIMTAHWDFSSATFLRALDIHIFHGALSFAIHSTEIHGFRDFLQSLNPYSEEDSFVRIFWEQAFNCLFPGLDIDEESCTGKEMLDSLPGPIFEMSMTGQSYSIYNSVYAIAYALHTMYSPRIESRAFADGHKMKPSKPHMQVTSIFLHTHVEEGSEI